MDRLVQFEQICNNFQNASNVNEMKEIELLLLEFRKLPLNDSLPWFILGNSIFICFILVNY